MTIKEWHIDTQWQEPFVAALRARGATQQQIGAALARVDSALTSSGQSASEAFGDPGEYGESVEIVGSAEGRASRIRAIGLAVIGLVGMFLALWGFSGVVWEVDALLGVPPLVWVIVGLVIAIGAAIADTALGRHADVFQTPAGEVPTSNALAFTLNRLAPWIIVALTGVGILLIWVLNG